MLKSPASPGEENRPPASYPAADFLANPATHGLAPGQLEICETHISWVVLTPTLAYKLKKPVRFEFLDFSTLSLRRVACEEELRLNRRLAPDVYLGVVPITRNHQGGLQLGGTGDVVDYVVRMKRLPHERMLDELICGGRVSEADVSRLAELLGRFYLSAAPLLRQPQEYRSAFERHVRANLADLLRCGGNLSRDVVLRVHSAQLQLLSIHPHLLDERVLDGRLIDGHGDLRPEHVCLSETPCVFDGLEFSRELREIDVADELSFLAMECERLGAPWIGDQILGEYQRRSGDKIPPGLLAFYKSYRACVRAKVAELRSAQLSTAAREAAAREAADYLALADRTAGTLGPPLLIVVRGLSGSGKSTLARALAECLAAQHLQTDEIRSELFPGHSPAGDTTAAAPSAVQSISASESARSEVLDRGKYQAQFREQVYEELFARARELLRRGQSVVLDGTFLDLSLRQRACELAEACGARRLFLRCECPPDVARERIAARLAAGGDSSEARPELVDIQQQREQPDPPDWPTRTVDATEALPEQLRSALAAAAELAGIV